MSINVATTILSIFLELTHLIPTTALGDGSILPSLFYKEIK